MNFDFSLTIRGYNSHSDRLTTGEDRGGGECERGCDRRISASLYERPAGRDGGFFWIHGWSW